MFVDMLATNKKRPRCLDPLLGLLPGKTKIGVWIMERQLRGHRRSDVFLNFADHQKK